MKNEKSLFFKIVTTIFLFVVSIVFSQNTSTVMNVDSSYDFGTGVFSKGSVSKSAMQSDGKIVIYGNFDLYGTTAKTQLARVNTDGTLDPSFSAGSGFPITAFVKSMKIDANGKILIAGTFNSFNGITVNNLIRLNSDGSLDNTFTIGTGPNGSVNGFEVQPDGKILIVGDFNSVNGTNRSFIARLNANGAVDTSFNPLSFTTNRGMLSVSCLKLLSDGKIYVGGTFGSYGGLNSNNIVRINADGSLDNGFNAFTSLQTQVAAIEVDPSNGKVFLAGGSAFYNGSFKGGLVSLDSSGIIDTNFNASGSAFGMGSGNVSDFFRLSDGTLLCGGMFSSYNSEARPGIAIINADGSLNTAFSGITGVSGQINTVLSQGNGSFLVGGSVSSFNGTNVNGFFKVNSSSTVDTSFSSQVNLLSKAFTSTPSKQSNDKVILGGNFTMVNGTSKSFLARLNTDGSLDSTFNNGGVGLNTSPTFLYVQPDDKIVAVGYFSSYNGTSTPGIVRLNADGTIDSTLNAVGTGFSMGTNYYVALTQTDGKILIGGSNFNTYNGTPITSKGLIRLNADGSLDTAFNNAVTGVNSGSNVAVYGLKQQTDGKILVTGNFNSFNTTTANGLVRLLANGTVDSSFAPASGGFNSSAIPRYITLQPDGKIVVTGTFTSYETVSRTNIVRINDNGSLDTSFTPGTGPSGAAAYAPVLMSDGKFLLPGSFTSYNGTTINRLARLNADGTLDTSFSPGSTGAQGYFYLFGQASSSNRITTIFPLADGKFLAAGNFTSYNGVAKNMFVKLEAVVTSNLSTVESSNKKWLIYPNPAKDFVNISNFNKGAQIGLYDMTGRLLFSTKALSATVTIDTSAYQSGVYVLKVDGQSSKLLISK